MQDDFAELLISDAVTSDRWGRASAYAATRDSATPRTTSDTRANGARCNLPSSVRTEHSEDTRRRLASTAGGCVEPISPLFRLPAKGVSNTLPCRYRRGAWSLHQSPPHPITGTIVASL